MSEIENTRKLTADELDAVTGGTKSSFEVLAQALRELEDKCTTTALSGALSGAAKGAT
jgi:hypothetical protein